MDIPNEVKIKATIKRGSVYYYKEESFDGVFLQAVLLHISKNDIEKVLEKLLTKLKLGGYLYIAVKEIKEGQSEEELKTENDYGYEYTRFFSYFTLDELKNILEKLKLKVIYEDSTSPDKTRWIKIIGQK